MDKETSYRRIKEDILEATNDSAAEFFALNLQLASDPEVSGEEFRSSERIVKLLRGKGFEVEYPFAGIQTAFRARKPGKTENGRVIPRKYRVAVMAEYDALPGIGHACGHSLSGAISCLAATVMAKWQDELNADIEIVGTPAEEIPGAKVEMIDRGVWDQYDMAIMVHLYNKTFAVPNVFALDEATFIFRGKAAHAASAPWEGVNALNALQLMFHAVDMKRQHLRPDARIHGIIREGGKAPGIVPDKAVGDFYVRATDKKTVKDLYEWLDRCAQAACLATGASYERVREDNPYDDIKPNPTGEACLREVLRELNIKESDDKSDIFASTDAGNVSYVCPTFHPLLKLAPEDVALHTKEFERLVRSCEAEKCLVQGAEIIGLQIAKIFSDEDIIRKMKEDFNSRD
jgi:amidohydrolase